jgi:hypothetical protein
MCRKKQVIKGGVPFLAAIFLGFVGYIFGFSLLSILICSVFFYFRIDAFIKDSLLWSADRTRLATTFYGISIFLFLEGWMFGYLYMNWLFAIVLIFTTLFIVGRFLQHVDRKHWLSQNIPLVLILAISAALTGLVTVVVYVVKWIFFKLMSYIVLLASIIGIPIIYLLQLIKIEIAPNKTVSVLQKQTKQLQLKDDQHYLLETIPIWIYLLLFIVVLLVIWFIVRKNRSLVDNYSPKSVLTEMIHEEWTAKNGRKRRFFRQPTPQEYMRKLFLQLHMTAEKYHIGRQQHETIQEWFQRVGFSSHHELFQAYESVRYGKNDIQKEDAVHLEQVITNLKREMKERYTGARE